MADINIPIYVTRSHSSQTGAFTLSPWLFLLTCLLVWLNVLGWSIFGLVLLIGEAVSSLG